MTQDVLVTIKGLHTAAESPQEDIEVVFPGTCRRLGDTWYVQYSEPVEGTGAEIRSLIKLRSDGLEVTKRGLTSTHMVFEEGKKSVTWYETPMGSALLGISATEVLVRETPEVIDALASYALEVNEQHAADCTINIRVTAKAEDQPERREKRDLPIGFFDSGVGGISVLRYAVRLLPHEDFLFFGDSANAPYGTRPEEEIRDLTLCHARQMYAQGIKALVVACNTATSAAISDLRAEFQEIPVIGIEPALKPAVHLGKKPTVVVMATPGTVSGQKFHRMLEKVSGEAKVIPLPCPGLMEYVERGIFGGQELEDYLTGLFAQVDGPIDGIVLGCTHYPFLRQAIRKVVGETVQILDGSEGTAHQLVRKLEEEDLLSFRERGGEITFEMSLPEQERLCRTLLEMELPV